MIITPQIENNYFNGIQKECVLVNIEGKDYEECVKANFWANKKGGVYGRGLGREDDDPHKPVRTGLLGQMAFGMLTDEEVDTEYREYGDQQDNLILGYKYDIKCSMKNYEKTLIYHISEKGRHIPVNKDCYVCSYVKKEDREKGEASIVIVGFALKKDVLECPVKPGIRGKHKNIEVPFHRLKPILGLIKSIFNLKERERERKKLSSSLNYHSNW